jgi:hypothetical protein
VAKRRWFTPAGGAGSAVQLSAPSPVVSSCPEPRTQPRCADTKLTSLAAKPGRTEADGLLGVEAGEGEAAADAAAGGGVETECGDWLEVPQAVVRARARSAAPAVLARMMFMPLRRRNALRRWTDSSFPARQL